LWAVLTGEFKLVLRLLDSNSEDSDTDISDVGDIDSDLEQEKQVRYDREVYREDAAELRKLEKGVTGGRKRKHGPSSSLKLEYVHGYDFNSVSF
jgi:hypothetical protein